MGRPAVLKLCLSALDYMERPTLIWTFDVPDRWIIEFLFPGFIKLGVKTDTADGGAGLLQQHSSLQSIWAAD